ncbi:MAG: hypothetical protein IPO88_32405 [Nannocystis sp.]|uniref:hypothetical protein n=1 Tax=Nannocystis sp. TaxID=1962667 RepID=UPI0024248708|nr:hypothetical protein [Nannocystis sp.]MBK9758137.1 hypothetical protein [Nannocystis sp.]
MRPRRPSPSEPDGPVSLRARRRPSPLVLLACLLVSVGLNYGSLWASLVLFASGERPVPLAQQKVCVNGQTRGLRLVDAALSGDPMQLLTGVQQVVVDGECEPVPVIVALVDDPPPERDPLAELLAPEPVPEKDKPRPKKKDREKEKELPPEPEPEKQPEPEQPKPEPEPEPEPQQEKIDFELQQLKMVEQMEDQDEKEAPSDAHYLSNINRDVTEETRSEISNLHKDADKAKAAQQEPSKDPEKGHADENKIAELRSRRASWRSRPPRSRSARSSSGRSRTTRSRSRCCRCATCPSASTRPRC